MPGWPRTCLRGEGEAVKPKPRMNTNHVNYAKRTERDHEARIQGLDFDPVRFWGFVSVPGRRPALRAERAGALRTALLFPGLRDDLAGIRWLGEVRPRKDEQLRLPELDGWREAGRWRRRRLLFVGSCFRQLHSPPCRTYKPQRVTYACRTPALRTGLSTSDPTALIPCSYLALVPLSPPTGAGPGGDVTDPANK